MYQYSTTTSNSTYYDPFWMWKNPYGYFGWKPVDVHYMSEHDKAVEEVQETPIGDKVLEMCNELAEVV